MLWCCYNDVVMLMMLWCWYCCDVDVVVMLLRCWCDDVVILLWCCCECPKVLEIWAYIRTYKNSGQFSMTTVVCCCVLLCVVWCDNNDSETPTVIVIMRMFERLLPISLLWECWWDSYRYRNYENNRGHIFKILFLMTTARIVWCGN